MNLRPVLASLALATCITGCATFTPQEMSQIQQRGVSPAVVGKLQDGHVLTPGDVIELTRRGVPDNFIIRQIEDTGLDYALNKNDVKRLQNAHVNRAVMEALFEASDDFAGRYAPGDHVHVYAGYPGYYSPYYYAPYPYYYPYGGVSVEVGGGRYWGGRHWR